MSLEKQWLARARVTYEFHRIRSLSDSSWTLSDTAKELRRSLGSVSEDIKIAQWLKTHSKKIEEFEYAQDALKWIRKKQKELDLTELT